MSNKFCTNCGAVVNPGVKFCGHCGTAVAKEHVTPDISRIKPDADKLKKFILPASYKKGLVSMKACTLIFTANEVIMAMVDKKLMQQHIADVKESVREEKLFKRTAAVMKAGYTYGDRYWEMTLSQIMSETPNNLSIRNSTIERIKFMNGTVNYRTDDTTTNTPPTLIIKSTGGKFTFTMNPGFDTNSLIKVLQSLFPGQYKGPKK